MNIIDLLIIYLSGMLSGMSIMYLIYRNTVGKLIKSYQEIFV